MKALKLVAPGKIELRDVPVPKISDNEVLVRIAAAGLCHSDLHILHQDDSWPFFGTTMGHETAGFVESAGAGVNGIKPGDAVLVRAVWSCGTCRSCRNGRGNACSINGSRTQFPLTPGLAVDGGMAEFIKVDARHLNGIGALDPVAAAPLADAGLTPMHVINTVRARLADDATVVVIGIGGLGHVALQILAAVSNSQIIAIDADATRVNHATSYGADLALLAGEDAATRILAETDGFGADIVIDFVGVQPTIDLARQIVAPEGAIRIVGLGGGSFPFNASLEGEVLPWGVNVQRPYGGTEVDQTEVLQLADDGKVAVQTDTYPLADAQRAFDDLANGKLKGRAVLIPG
ncbi:NAD(P)-dependent alcohol dehydrogenase [Skermania sp. ID1734]|uniref:NAD(P)-dependent alcohol dehydrogenase n=1 Tax=Skermania sp. ID1734 TaxID=2597516 RepID=UPI0011807B1D|nr:NAD(P)-dependent alcohol dehydrogenase [Skermania sp. ID1734]TSD94067.1 NAD(P)-dependent alcohol dehydrogenase [Skermania sp. ID1734]